MDFCLQQASLNVKINDIETHKYDMPSVSANKKQKKLFHLTLSTYVQSEIF